MNCSGIYFLASRFLDGSYIYKVGKAGCIKDRINQYPQNFDLILQFECINKNISEREVIKVVECLENVGITKCERGNEYFRSEKDMIREIKLAIYDWYYEIERTRTKEPTVETNVENLSLGEESSKGKRIAPANPEAPMRLREPERIHQKYMADLKEKEEEKPKHNLFKEECLNPTEIINLQHLTQYLEENVNNTECKYPYLKIIPDDERVLEVLNDESLINYDLKNKHIKIDFTDYCDYFSYYLIYIITNLNDKVEKLTVINSGITITIMEKMMIGLKDSNIKSLSIRKDYLALGSIKILIKYLSNYCKKIHNLELSDTGIDYNKIKYIFNNINSTGITTLDISNNDLCVDCISFFAEKTYYSTLKELKIKGLTKILIAYLNMAYNTTSLFNKIFITKNKLNVIT